MNEFYSQVKSWGASYCQIFSHFKFELSDEVIYKEDKKLTWQGLAKATSVDGVKIRIVHDSYVQTIHKSLLPSTRRKQMGWGRNERVCSLTVGVWAGDEGSECVEGGAAAQCAACVSVCAHTAHIHACS